VAEGELAGLEEAEPLRDDELGWTGALE
jgi:hypothetical protein